MQKPLQCVARLTALWEELGVNSLESVFIDHTAWALLQVTQTLPQHAEFLTSYHWQHWCRTAFAKSCPHVVGKIHGRKNHMY